MNEVTAADTSVEDLEPTQADLEVMAVKQLMMELNMIKRRVYESKTLMNSVLIVQIRGVLNGLIRKYNEASLFLGETIDIKLSDYGKHASIIYVYSPVLGLLIKSVVQEISKQQKPVVSEVEEVK